MKTSSGPVLAPLDSGKGEPHLTDLPEISESRLERINAGGPVRVVRAETDKPGAVGVGIAAYSREDATGTLPK